MKYIFFFSILILLKFKGDIPVQNGRAFKKGTYIFIEGDEESSSVFLVKKGRVAHVCRSPILSRALKDAGEGDFFGFISAFSGRPRLSSAMAVEDTVAVEIESGQLLRMLRDKPQIAMKIMHSYSHTLQQYDNVLMDIKPISLLYPQSMSLYNLGEYYMQKGETLIADYIFNRYIQLFPDSENITDVEKLIDENEDTPGFLSFTENGKGELLFRENSVIFCEHEPGDSLYLIEEGRVKIIKQNKERDMLLAVLGEGDIFGELALLTSSPRSATALSFGGVRVTPVDMDRFSGLITISPELVKRIITSISQRLWFNHIRLSIMSYRNPVTRLFAFLEGKLMEDGVSLTRKTPHQFQFGLDELINMNELSTEQHRDEINELVNNRHLSFNFGTITVSNPKEFSADIEFYKQRDRIPSLKRRTLSRPGVNKNEVEDYAGYAEGEISEAANGTSTHGFVDDEIAEIIPDLNNDDPSKRVNAVIRLGTLGEKARGSVPLLRDRLGDEVKIIRKNAARSILNILPPGESFKMFSEALSDSNQGIRSSAVTGLGALNIADRSGIIDLLVKSLKDSSPEVRSSAARSLGSLGIDAEGAAPGLIRLLSDKESSVRILAVNSLEKITGKGGYLNEALNAIKTVSKNDPDKFVKNSARDALIKLNRRKKTS